MKSFVITATLFSLLASVWADSTLPTVEEKAIQECNITIPVQRNTQLVLSSSIATGDKFNLSRPEKCFLLCTLQKVGFLDENGSIRNGTAAVKYILGKVPELAKYTDVLIAHVFQLSRATKGFDDKCAKSYIIYHQFGTFIFTLAIADSLERDTGVKDKVVKAIEARKPLDAPVSEKVKTFLGIFDASISAYAKETTESSTPALNPQSIP